MPRWSLHRECKAANMEVPLMNIYPEGAFSHLMPVGPVKAQARKRCAFSSIFGSESMDL
eukprot:m.161036 g.161036  ORF g.161036 m.161036 type:complete len:59 (-) comp15183_c0_seq1:11441-11617(-)